MKFRKNNRQTYNLQNIISTKDEQKEKTTEKIFKCSKTYCNIQMNIWGRSSHKCYGRLYFKRLFILAVLGEKLNFNLTLFMPSAVEIT